MSSQGPAQTMAPGSRIHMPNGQVHTVGKAQKALPTYGQKMLEKKLKPVAPTQQK